jgi:sugar/nucleoside kinase (ribokinase family)
MAMGVRMKKPVLSASKKTLVVGSTAVDVILRLPGLPKRGEDINIAASSYRIGGCAYNVYKAMCAFEEGAKSGGKSRKKAPALLCSPVGTGIYGRMVREHFAARKIKPFVQLKEENGCCYCLVEADGERSFISWHGAEYLFSKDWFGPPWRDEFDFSSCDSVYISGIDIEEKNGGEIVKFIAKHPDLAVFFAPGPRLDKIPEDLMAKIFKRKPFLHLNEAEALSLAGCADVREAADRLCALTGNDIVITLGKLGCYYQASAAPSVSRPGQASAAPPAGKQANDDFIPAYPATVVDTVGAGDAHCGTLIAALKAGLGLKEACEAANKAAALSVEEEV